MKHEQALLIAQEIVTCIAPYCERVEIAGSIRRGKSVVKDVEIVAIPKWEAHLDESDLFGEWQVAVNLLYEWATRPACPVQWIKPGTPDVVPWKVEPQGRYWRGLLKNELKLDLFLATPENFGTIFLIRTGSAEFSYAVATHAKKIGRPFVNGYLTVDGQPVATPEERGVFELLGLEWREPNERLDWQSVQVCSSISPTRRRPRRTTPPDTALARFVWQPGDIEIIKPST